MSLFNLNSLNQILKNADITLTLNDQNIKTSLREIDIDSLDIMKIFFEIEKIYNVKFENSDIEQSTSFEKIIFLTQTKLK